MKLNLLARVPLALCVLLAANQALAHGDMGALLVVGGLGTLVLVTITVIAITMIIHRLATNKALAEQAATGQAQGPQSKLPWWFWLLVLSLSVYGAMGLVTLLGLGMGLGVAMAKGANIGPVFALLSRGVLTIVLPIAALIGIAGFKRWGWWLGVLFMVWVFASNLNTIYQVSTSPNPGGGRAALWFALQLGFTAPLALLLLPRVRERFLGQKPKALRVPISRPAPTTAVGPKVWQDTQPLTVDKAVPQPAVGEAVSTPAAPKGGISKAEWWFGGAVLFGVGLFVGWLYAGPWLQVQLDAREERALESRKEKAIEEAADRAEKASALARTQLPSKASEKPTEKLQNNAPAKAAEKSSNDGPFDPQRIEPMAEADFTRIASNFPPDLGKPSLHCHVGLYKSAAEDAPQLTIWRSTGGSQLLMYVQDGQDHWYGRALHEGAAEKPTRLGNEGSKVRFQLWKGEPVAGNDTRMLDLEFTTKASCINDGQRCDFKLKTSMKTLADMHGREQCAYPAALAYLLFQPSMYVPK
jgi:hypothetical protein